MNLSKEDYEETCCPFKNPDEAVPVPLGRIIEKLDEYLNKKDYFSAQKHLEYWISEAEFLKDINGKLAIINEQIGLYRKLDKSDKGIFCIENALKIIERHEFVNTITAGTTLINCATALKSFGYAQEALPLYEKAKKIYEANLKSDDERFAGLYNNMAVSVMELGNYEKARELFYKAVEILQKSEKGEAETAVTYCNLADLEFSENGPEKSENQIKIYLDTAYRLLTQSNLPEDGNYAFVCEKCAPVFGYYGFFAAENELQKRADKIYERT